MPSSKSSGPWTLSEMFGQRKLLGVGALLAWLFLFHLLVNVWLLCVFTSLLVVLGGWLGSRAALDANSLLHLEHFLPLGDAHPPPPSPEHEWRLNHEIQSAVHKAVRDFVSSWYRALLPGEEGEFEGVVRRSMLASVMELKERARRVDRTALVRRLLELYGRHLQSYMAARQIRATRRERPDLWQLYRDVETPHPAVSSPAAELNFSRALVDLVLHTLVPYPEMETRTGAYVVTELITCNVLLPLISRVSDPDWLNQTIVDVVTKSREPQEAEVDEVDEPPAEPLYRCQTLQESWSTCRSQSSSDDDPTGFSSISTSDLDDLQSQSAISGSDPSQDSMLSLLSTEQSCCRLSSGRYSQASASRIISVDSIAQSDSEEDLAGRFCECGPTTNFCNLLMLRDDEPSGCFGTLRHLGPKAVVPEDPPWPADAAPDRSPACSHKKLSLNSYNFDSSSNAGAHVNIQKVEISGTVSVKEQRSASTHPYTLYTVKFETAADNSPQPAARHTVNRRYSEFLNLQTRLEEKPDVRKLIKNVKGPKKTFPDLPFGSPDMEKVEGRKSQLDAYLKQLSSIPETANSEDMQEFLAVNADVCTYFGRRASCKSRIDKMMENAMDTLRTAFPHPDLLSPTEDMDADAEGRAMDSRKYRRLFSTKISPSLNISDLHPKVTYCFSEGNTVLNGTSLSGLESFIREQERLLCEPNESEKAKPSYDLQRRDNKLPGKPPGTDTAVADVALNILCLLMKDQWSWLCTENIQKAIRLLFGTFIERFLYFLNFHYLTSLFGPD
ncbi:sorting nexin-19a isoform X2 [Cololabis saira]|uniref:sorting nexin-19a isoform X2 n=1 Tax=Cololabis saira TaxID=129043 RepID=UPI002AD33FDC|nr:sorting nexin-19a isoform X2 [Cololabis saira]